MSRPYQRNGYEAPEAWALRLVTDPMLSVEPLRAIAELTGCDLVNLRAARTWVREFEAGMPEARRIIDEHSVEGTPADVIRAALVCYELHLMGQRVT